MSLILAIFILVLIAEVISWIGKSVLADFFFAIYLRVFHSSTSRKQHNLKADILAKKAELLKTSAQDQFAKWAKLRRSVDKGLADLEALNSQLAATRSYFTVQFNALLWLLTTGLGFAIGAYYRQAAVFYLPPGWFGPLEPLLALPWAPKGAVSVTVWQASCRRAIRMGGHIIRGLCVPVEGRTEPAVKQDANRSSSPAARGEKVDEVKKDI
ncbi:hypothetical protein FISHEDRAFT_59755 [Fistulina hepatica ATCC 64428]|uniref:Uncharacterized protein n=1 Tax=Fistulina hepatica ATCC 64428 TaxID=1128425 RepID=A0A0D7A943_9AGAR|nr:hypothetical protein FISHEDRAFT_59755 [Fistulina hepatica ATCC 64428]